MKPGVKQDLSFAIIALLSFACYTALGFALGKVNYAQVADMILTNWIMTGIGMVFLAAIIYTGVKGAIHRDRKTNEDPTLTTSSYLSGTVVAIIVGLCVIVLVVVVAYAILSDS